MADPAPATPVGLPTGLQVMSPSGFAGVAVAGQEAGAQRALLNGVMSPSAAPQKVHGQGRQGRVLEQWTSLFWEKGTHRILGLVSAPASPQALHPLMEQPSEFHKQLHPSASGTRQPHQAVATMTQNGPSNLAGAGWTAAVRLMGRFGEALQRAGRRFMTTLTRQQVMGTSSSEGSSLLLQHHQQTLQHTAASSDGGGSSGSIPRELVQEEVRRQVQAAWEGQNHRLLELEAENRRLKLQGWPKSSQASGLRGLPENDRAHQRLLKGDRAPQHQALHAGDRALRPGLLEMIGPHSSWLASGPAVAARSTGR